MSDRTWIEHIVASSEPEINAGGTHVREVLCGDRVEFRGEGDTDDEWSSLDYYLESSQENKAVEHGLSWCKDCIDKIDPLVLLAYTEI